MSERPQRGTGRRVASRGSGARRRASGSGASRGAASRGTASRGAGARRSSAASRRAPPPKGFPVVLIVLPAVGIVGLLAWMFWPQGEAPPDPNTRIEVLQNQIPEMQKEYREVVQLLRAENAEGTERARALEVTINTWMDDWAALFESKRDANGDLPPDLQGYDQIAGKIAELRFDLMRVTNF